MLQVVIVLKHGAVKVYREIPVYVQLHTLPLYPPRKQPLVPHVKKGVGNPDLVWILWHRERPVALPRIRYWSV
jgi:hypothetical protein